MKKALLILGISVGIVSHAACQNTSIKSDLTTLIAGHTNCVSFDFENPTITLKDVFVECEMPIRVLNEKSLAVLVPEQDRLNQTVFINLIRDGNTYAFKYQLIRRNRPTMMVYFSDGSSVPPMGIPINTTELRVGAVLADNIANQEPYRVQKVRVSLAEGTRLIVDHEYEAQDFNNNPLQLEELYAKARRSPKPGDRIVVEALSVTQLIGGQEVTLSQNLTPHSITLR